MVSLPTDDEVRARAEELALLEPGADLAPDVRRRVAKQLLDERQAPKATPAGPELSLLSRATYPVDGGVIRVDVLFVPNPTKEPTNG